jgi:hypothetical protein
MLNFGTAWKALDHSLVAVVVGVTAIPWLVNRLNEHDRIQEGRHRIAVEILDNGFRGERDFNTLTTLLALFHKDAAHAPVTALRGLQTDARSKINEQYVSFDRFIWWWRSEIADEVKALPGVTAEEQRALRKLSEAYDLSLRISLRWLDQLLRSHLRVDLAESVKRRGEPFTDSERLQEGLKTCGAARRNLFSDMAYLFSPNAKPNFARLIIARADRHELSTCISPPPLSD